MNGRVNETFLAALESYIFLLLVGGEYASLFLLMPSRDSHAFPTANLHGVYRCLLKAAHSPVSKPSEALSLKCQPLPLSLLLQRSEKFRQGKFSVPFLNMPTV